MIGVALPAAIGMELGSLIRIRLVEAEFVEAGAAWIPIEFVADDFVCDSNNSNTSR
jgi:hypothetical protein